VRVRGSLAGPEGAIDRFGEGSVVAPLSRTVKRHAAILRSRRARSAAARSYGPSTSTAAPGRAYTDDPTFKLPGESEPIDEDFQRLLSTAVRARFEHERAHELARRENRSRSARLRTAQSEALALGVDGRSELRSIDTAIDLLSRKNARARALAWAPTGLGRERGTSCHKRELTIPADEDERIGLVAAWDPGPPWARRLIRAPKRTCSPRGTARVAITRAQFGGSPGCQVASSPGCQAPADQASSWSSADRSSFLVGGAGGTAL
jgi:hypothetical protein